MKWFKHMTDARFDEQLAIAMETWKDRRAGIEIYGTYFMVLEIIAEQSEKGECAARKTLGNWAAAIGISPKITLELLRHLHKHSLIRLRVDKPVDNPVDNPVDKSISGASKTRSKRVVNVYHAHTTRALRAHLVGVTIPNLLKFHDDYSRKKSKCPDTVRTLSGHCPEPRARAVDLDLDLKDLKTFPPPTPPRREKTASVGGQLSQKRKVKTGERKPRAAAKPAKTVGTPMWSSYSANRVLAVAAVLGVKTAGKSDRELLPELKTAFIRADDDVRKMLWQILKAKNGATMKTIVASVSAAMSSR